MLCSAPPTYDNAKVVCIPADNESSTPYLLIRPLALKRLVINDVEWALPDQTCSQAVKISGVFDGIGPAIERGGVWCGLRTRCSAYPAPLRVYQYRQGYARPTVVQLCMSLSYVYLGCRREQDKHRRQT
jgi:hypothetical protein